MPRLNPLVALALLLVGLIPGCDKGAAASTTNPTEKEKVAPRPPLVRVTAVELRQIRNEVRDTAYLEAERRIMVQAKVTGRVQQVLVDEGNVVSAGQLLAQIDDREAKTTLAQVEVQLADATVRRDLARLESDASVGRLEQAKIERSIAEADWKRNSALDPAIVSPKVFDDSKFALDKAEEAVRVADFNRLKAELEVKTAENKIEELKNKLEETRLKLAEHEIKAPFAGMVVKRNVTGGETIGGTATSLFELADLGHLIAWISRPQRELAVVRNAKEVVFTADAYPGKEFTADVDLVSPIVDQATGSFRVRMRVRADDAKALVAGLFIRARILTEELREALMVPKAAVLAEGDRSVVFVVREDRAHKVTLDPGLEERDWVESRNRGDDGVRPDDRVIVSGHEDLRDQAVVEVSKD